MSKQLKVEKLFEQNRDNYQGFQTNTDNCWHNCGIHEE